MMRHSALLILFIFSLAYGQQEKPNDLSIIEFGADPNGMQDSTTAIQNAINQARSTGVNVYIPNGTFKHNDVIRLSATQMYGNGITSILYATDEENRAVQMEGESTQLRNIKVTGYSQARKNKGWNNSVFVNHADYFRIANVTIIPTTNYNATVVDNQPVVFGIGGIISYYSNHGIIEGCTVAWTWADGIHTTGTATNHTIRYNTVHHVGDDSIPVVSYAPDEVSNVLIYRNTIYNNIWARGIPVVGGYQIQVIENNLANILDAAFWVASEISFKTTAPHDVIYARNTVINATNAFTNCAADYTGHPTTGVSNGYSAQGSIYNVLFVDNTFTTTCKQHIKVEGDTVGEVVYAGNTFTNAIQSTVVELVSSTASLYSVKNVYNGGQVNGFYAGGARNGLYSLADSIANINGGSKRGYWLKDGDAKFNNLQIQNVGLAAGNTASFWPFLGANDATDSLQIINVYNAGNQVPANKGQLPPTASDFTVTKSRPANGKITFTASDFLSRSSSSATRLLAVFGGVGGVVDISFAHDSAVFTIRDNTRTSYTFNYAVRSSKYGAAVAKVTISIASSATLAPTNKPSPTAAPTPKPPTAAPTPKPPTAAPTPKPPTAAPTPKPPTTAPTPKPPTATPTSKATASPTQKPTAAPTQRATAQPTTKPAAAVSYLNSDSGISSDDNPNYLLSDDGRFKFTVQSNGDIVLTKNGVWLWNSGAVNGVTTAHLNLQSDNNLVLYSQAWAPIWSSGTSGSGASPSRLIVQGDGNVVIYDNNGRAIWSTGTYGN